MNDPWKGKSGLNDYADFVMETDAVVGGPDPSAQPAVEAALESVVAVLREQLA